MNVLIKISKSEKSLSVSENEKSQREMREFQKSKDMTTDEKVSGESRNASVYYSLKVLSM